MTYRVELAIRAVRDLENLYQYIHADDSKQAAKWYNRLEALVLSLRKHPNRGTVIPENKKHRHLLYGNKPHIYRIIYRVDESSKVVRIFHIRHSARDVVKP